MSVGEPTRTRAEKGCRAKTRRGKPCRAGVVHGTRFCALHGDTARAAELGRMGGRKNRHYVAADEVKFDAPSTPAEVRNMLSQAMADVRAGKLDPRIANSMTAIANALLKALELADLEERIARLKEELQGRFETSPGSHR